jgi:methyl-accepting chemotaxis protein
MGSRLFRGGPMAMNHYQSILRRLGINENRKARNLLLKPALQLKLALYALMLSLVFILLTLLFGKLYFEQTYITLVENTTQGEYIQAIITQQMHDFKSMSLLLLVGYTVMMVVLITVYTHRMIGPTLPIMRHIKALKNGFYSHRVKLRRHDCFQELADELNTLAETLEQRK